MSGQSESGTLGSGQQTPFDGTSEADVFLFMCRQLIAELETMLPVQVQTLHAGSGSPPSAGTVDVQLLVSLIDGDSNRVDQGIVYGVPYFRLQGGKWAIVCDPAVGDIGFLISASRDISNFKANPTSQQLPGSRRKYRYADGVYVGGILNAVPKGTIWLKPDGTLDLKTADGLEIKSDGSGNCAITGNVAVTGNITATGNVVAGQGGADQVGLQTHMHPTAAPGSPSSPTPGT